MLAAALTGAGALGGEELGRMIVPNAGLLHDATTLGCAIAAGGAGYIAVAILFRRVLPLGRFAGNR